LADRLDRRRIVLFGLLVMAMASLGLAIVSHRRGSVEWMYAMLLFSAGDELFFGPPARRCCPSWCPAALSAAPLLESTGYQIACVTGPALADS